MGSITLSNINCWDDFKSYAESMPNTKSMGNAFEQLTKLYFQINPLYKSMYDNVWLMDEVPHKDLEYLELPRQDLGIDLIVKSGSEYHAIQCKYHSNKNTSINNKEVATFTSLLANKKKLSHGYICSTAIKTSSNYNKLNINNVSNVLYDSWAILDKDFFDNARKKLDKKNTIVKPYKPKPHQANAIKLAHKHFIKENNSRGKLIFPCGSGKSLTGFWIMEKLAAKSTIVAVPSLSLIKQTLEVYLKQVVAKNKKVKWLCICSDDGIGKSDDVVTYTRDLPVPCTTDKEYIKQWLKENKKEEIIIFTTYQSGRIIAEISKSLKYQFDIGIYDEAHKTVGKNENLFSYLLFEYNISVRHRVFMTATERFYRGVKDDVLTMDDPEDYGDVFCHMTFKEAIEKDLLTDYKIITIEVKKEEIAGFIKDNNLVQRSDKWKKETEARSLASMIALRKAMKRFPIKNAVSFHSSIERAIRNKDVQDDITSTYNYKPIDTFHVSGKVSTSKRNDIVNEFARSKRSLITNSRCLTEGVDVPNIDCIVFADPRKSKVDIVQALGRALRKKLGKEWGYVVLPVIYDKTSNEIDNENFQEILNVIRGLAANDERIIEEFKDKSQKSGRVTGAREEIFSIDPALITESDLVDNLNIKLWEKLSRFNWMPFQEAREFVRGLNLVSAKEWQTYSASALRPSNIPSSPQIIYLKSGWNNWGDFLGTGTLASKDFEFLSFKEARDYARGLNLKTVENWFALKDNRPSNIPSVPKKTYQNSGWSGWGDFLGIDNYRYDEEWMPFKKARSFVRKQNLKNAKDWYAILKTDKIPYNIPKSPALVYKNQGWKSIGDWIGTDRIADQFRKYMSYDDAKKFMLENKIISRTQWTKFRKENNIQNIPFKLERTYSKSWKGDPDFFGTKVFNYQEAKTFIQKFNIKSSREYFTFLKTKDSIINLPTVPSRRYKQSGWINWKEFLGYKAEKRGINKREYLSYFEAKKFLKKLNFKSSKEYLNYLKKDPTFKTKNRLSTHPYRIYKDQGWNGYQDFLGYSDDVRKKTFVDYQTCREFAIKSGIQTSKEWGKLKKSRPSHIPSDPSKIYFKRGWKGWADFLGKKD